MPARCIECRGTFNRAVAEDKLRCPQCTKSEPRAEEKPKGAQKSLRDQLKKYKKHGNG